MTRRARGKSVAVALGPPHMSKEEHMSTDITSAENGFIVNVSASRGGNNPAFVQKKFVAQTRPDAMQIAANHFSGATVTKGGRKTGFRKKVSTTKF